MVGHVTVRCNEYEAALSLAGPMLTIDHIDWTRRKRIDHLAGFRVCRIDEVFQNVRRPKIDHAAPRDGDFFAGSRIAPDALTLLAHRKTAEQGNLDCFALGQGIGDLAQYGVDEVPTFVSG